MEEKINITAITDINNSEKVIIIIEKELINATIVIVKKYFIIDFDSTFVQSEGLEELAAVALKNKPDRNLIVEKIKKITNLGMEGKISFSESLIRRLSLLEGNKLHINQVVKILKKKIKEFILPIVKPFGIEKNHVFANSFLLDDTKKIVGLDFKNPLSGDGGKIKVVKNLNLKGDISVIGDGYTDYQIKVMGAANHFIAPNFDEFLFINKLPRSYSYPKNRIKVLLYKDLRKNEFQLFNQEGYHVLNPTRRVALIKEIKNAHVLVCSKLNYLTERIIKEASLLMTVGVINPNRLKNKSIFIRKRIVFFAGSKDTIAKKIVDFINTGNTKTSLNTPQVNLKKVKDTHRLLHFHRNVPGILARVNGVMAKYGLNILAQSLNTNKEIGYVITDVNQRYDKNVLNELKQIPSTIRFRVLY